MSLDLAAVGTAGCLLFASVLARARKPDSDRPAEQALRTAGWCAGIWAVAALVGAVLTVSDIAGLPLTTLLVARSFPWWLVSLPPSGLLLVSAGLAGLVAYLVRGVRTAEGRFPALVLAVVAVLPPLFSGHAAGDSNHEVAIASLIVHVLAITVWVGGLIGVVAFGRTLTDVAPIQRFSTIALVCFVATGLSGVVNASLRLASGDGIFAQLLESRYGWLVLAKLAALGTLFGFGYWHRRVTIRRFTAGRPRAFRRFAGCEVLIMSATIGLAVALSRTPSPVPDEPVTIPGIEYVGLAPPGPAAAAVYGLPLSADIGRVAGGH